MKIFAILILSIPFFAHSKSYQVGEFWSKKHIASASKRVQVLKEAVGEVGARATLFYIGEYGDKHFAITNYHVCPAEKSNRCLDQRVSFFYFKNKRGKSLEGKIIDVPLTVKNLDLSLVEISFKNIDQFDKYPTPLKISSSRPYLNQKLISIGYGSYNNEYGVLMIEEDSFECQVFSRQNRLLKDPDTYNPIDYKVRSFLHGCDVSHGDSGSPIIDRDSLEVVGLLWSGKYPKHDSVSQADFDKLPIEFLWGELNYASPGHLIYEELDEFFLKKNIAH